MSSSKKQIILIALSVVLVVLFLFMPEKPASVKNHVPPANQEQEKPSDSSVESRIKAAIKKVQGEAPMMGILELKAIADEDPSQVDAQYFLGISSIQIGELEKAVDRFKKVITFAGLKKYPDSRLKLAECLENLDRKEEAIEQLEIELKESNVDSEGVKAILDRLRN